MLRHAIGSILLGGWLLMQPETYPSDFKLDLSLWDEISEHASFADCERERKALKASATKILEDDEKHGEAILTLNTTRPPYSPDLLQRAAAAETAMRHSLARCAPADRVHQSKVRDDADARD